MKAHNGIITYQDVEAIETGIADLELHDSTYEMIKASQHQSDSQFPGSYRG